MELDTDFIALCRAIASSCNSNAPPTSPAVTLSPTATAGAYGDLDPKDVDVTGSYAGAMYDSFGLPSTPLSIFKTGPSGQRVLREARPMCNHPIQRVWPKLGKRLYKFLDSREVKTPS